jgi:hypothetical protein
MQESTLLGILSKADRRRLPSPVNLAISVSNLGVSNGSGNTVIASPGAVVGSTISVTVTNGNTPFQITFSDRVRNAQEKGAFVTHAIVHVESQYAVPSLFLYASGDHLYYLPDSAQHPFPAFPNTIEADPIAEESVLFEASSGFGVVVLPDGTKKLAVYERIPNAHGNYKLTIRSTNIDNIMFQAKVE